MKTLEQDKLLNHFLSKFDMDDIEQSIEGELSEYATDDYSAWFGNGELILYPEGSEEPNIYVIDSYGFKKYLVAI